MYWDISKSAVIFKLKDVVGIVESSAAAAEQSVQNAPLFSAYFFTRYGRLVDAGDSVSSL